MNGLAIAIRCRELVADASPDGAIYADDVSLDSLGLDCLDRNEILWTLEDDFRFRASDTETEIAQWKTIGDVIAYTQKKAGGLMIATHPENPVHPVRSDLRPHIERYIDERDAAWKRLAYLADPARADLAHLATLNLALREMLALRSGPVTPVLDPQRASVEILRCKVCEVFIFRLDRELHGRETATGMRSAILGAIRFLNAAGIRVEGQPEQVSA